MKTGMKLMSWVGLLGILGVTLVMLTAASRPNQFVVGWQTLPQAIPTVLTNVCSMGTNIPCQRDLYVCYADVNTGPGGAAINITIRDNQASPIPFFSTVPVTPTSSAGQSMQIIQVPADQGCRWFPGGVFVQASATGAYIYLSGKY